MWTLLAIAVPPNPAAQMARLILVTAGIATLIGGAIWTAWILRAVQRDLHRHRHGCCLSCGYDLRHCKDRCSECGAPIRNAHRADENLPPSPTGRSERIQRPPASGQG